MKRRGPKTSGDKVISFKIKRVEIRGEVKVEIIGSVRFRLTWAMYSACILNAEP